MEIFDAEIKKDEAGRLTIIEVPFDAREVFHKLKGTILVKGTINEIEYRSKLLSRGNGRFIMVLDKVMQNSLGFNGKTMTAHITMDFEEGPNLQKDRQDPIAASYQMDVMTAINTRQSIRKFASEPIEETELNKILAAGLCAPTAKNKRPYHFLVIKDRQLLSELAQENSNAAMLETAPCAIVVCGDKNIEGIKEFLYEDCAAATQNILLCIHGLGLGGVWCGVKMNSAWQKLMITRFALPPKLEPITVIAVGRPDETKDLRGRWEPEKIHYNKW